MVITLANDGKRLLNPSASFAKIFEAVPKIIAANKNNFSKY